jgi:hypothetical protein
MTRNLKTLKEEILALSAAEQAELLSTLVTRLQPIYGFGETHSHVAEARQSYAITSGEPLMEKQVQQLLRRLEHLPPARQAQVGEFIEFLHQRELGKLINIAYAQASENSFAKVWDNNEDAIYDTL